EVALALARSAPPDRVEAAVAGLQSLVSGRSAQAGVSKELRCMRVLTEQIAGASRNIDWTSVRGETRINQAEAARPAALRSVVPLEVLRANLHFSSVAFRHAIRMATLLLLAGLVS